MGDTVLHDNDQFIPVASLVVFQVFIRPGQRVVAALQLGLADEHATVSIRRSTEFKFECDIAREFANRIELLNSTTLSGCGDDESAVFRQVATIVRDRLAIMSPASEILSIEQALKARFEQKIVRYRFHKTECRQNRSKGARPFHIAGFIGMQQIGHLFRLRISLSVRKQRPGINDSNLRITFNRCETQFVDQLNIVSRTIFCR